MPIVGVLFAVLMFGGGGFAVGAVMGALAMEVLHQRRLQARASQGAEIRPEEWNSAGCGALLVGSFLGGVIVCAIVLVGGYLVVRFGE